MEPPLNIWITSGKMWNLKGNIFQLVLCAGNAVDFAFIRSEIVREKAVASDVSIACTGSILKEMEEEFRCDGSKKMHCF